MDRRPSRRAPLVPSLALAGAMITALGCVGDIARDDLPPSEDPAGTGDPGEAPPAETAPTTPAGRPAPAAGTTAAPGAAAEISGFALPAEQLQLLPFGVRLSRLVGVVGLPATDPVYEALRANRTALGDHDYANGIKPDNTWTALRVSEWVRGLKPVCASAAMRARYPALPDSLGALVGAAYGRSPRAEDQKHVTESLAGLTLDERARYQTICLAVLSSLEFLAQ